MKENKLTKEQRRKLAYEEYKKKIEPYWEEYEKKIKEINNEQDEIPEEIIQNGVTYVRKK